MLGRLAKTGLAVVAMAVALAVAAPTWGESILIELTGGKVLEGRVFDLGEESLEIRGRLGTVKIRKREVVRWNLRYNDDSALASVILLKSGQEIPGKIVRWQHRGIPARGHAERAEHDEERQPAGSDSRVHVALTRSGKNGGSPRERGRLTGQAVGPGR